MSLNLAQFAYTNRLRRLPPEHKLGFAIALFILGYTAPPPIQWLITLWVGVWIVVYGGIPLSVYGKLLSLPLGFGVLSLPPLVLSGVSLSQISEIQEDIWQGFFLGGFYLYLSQQGLQQAGEMLSRAIALTSCLYFILLTIPLLEIIRLLQKLRCPSLILDLLLLMYRFIFLLMDTANELILAQNARFGYHSFNRSLHSLGLLITQLLHRTLENYRASVLGLQSRGFNGEFRVLHQRRYSPNLRYSIEAVLGLVLIILATLKL
ncbi:cobalt ECF transporter T component CbiQ [Spirulina subsalsa FACHB-351]|uniref:Cobalt ECF transporter T component CbiQ n=1 Tax=Spirulina subsalsa FACHB-351 TaxID=234711 RepID=A0ABT3L0C6_9CYAN|nr:cobalt ECF transporter T component CbiQ [Spirulina subsalsa]MCW6034935.1 cobalt ECF transporter T component CbiQ [Spirulina subsalsa FACHB-351]